MKKITKYFLNRKSNYIKYSEFVLDNSFDVRKKLGDGIGIIKLFDSEMINYSVSSILEKHFKKIIELLLKLEEDDDPSSGLIFCLDEADRLKKEIINKYSRYLDKKQKSILEKKIELIENDIKNKLILYRMNMMSYNHPLKEKSEYYEDEKEEIHRHR